MQTAPTPLANTPSPSSPPALMVYTPAPASSAPQSVPAGGGVVPFADPSPELRIPAADLEEYHAHPARERSQILLWISRLEPMLSIKGRDKLWKTWGAYYDVKPGTLKNRFYAYQNHGWRGLVDQRKPGPHRDATRHAGLPLAFLKTWHDIYLTHQRDSSGREAHRRLLEMLDTWRRPGAANPGLGGYQTPPANVNYCRTSRRQVPAGWSYSNLMRHLPDTYSRVLIRQGPKAARKYLPDNLQTRVGLRYRQRLYIDDQDYDLKIVVPGSAGAFERPVGFNVLDHATACFEKWSLKLPHREKDTAKLKTLTQRDFVWTVIDTLRGGWRDDDLGTTLIGEHGTAKGPRRMSRDSATTWEERLYHVSDGRILFEASGLYGDPAFREMMFRGQSGGNPDFKAPMESIFNLVRNRMAALPAPTGLNPTKKQEESYGLENYTQRLLTIAARLPEELRSQIQYPALTLAKFAPIADTIYKAINNRRDHQLEGWLKQGYTREEWSFNATGPQDEAANWAPAENFLALPEEQRAALYQIVQVRSVHLSPSEAAALERQRDRRALRRPSMAQLLSLIPDDWAIPITVSEQRQIRLWEPTIDREPLHYLAAEMHTLRGEKVSLRPGAKMRALLNPYDPSVLYLLTEDGRYAGEVPEWSRAAAHDRQAILRNQGHINEVKAQLDAVVRPHVEAEGERRQAMVRANEILAGQAGQTATSGITKRTKAKASPGAQGTRKPAPAKASPETATATLPRPAKAPAKARMPEPSPEAFDPFAL